MQRDDHDRHQAGFMLWEALVAAALLAIITPALLNTASTLAQAERRAIRQQAALRGALSIADWLAAGGHPSVQMRLDDPLLPRGIACLTSTFPHGLRAIRWQPSVGGTWPDCQGDWPRAQQLCLATLC